jgi:hypothetical protein
MLKKERVRRKLFRFIRFFVGGRSEYEQNKRFDVEAKALAFNFIFFQFLARFNRPPAVCAPIRTRRIHPNERFGATRIRGSGGHGDQKIRPHQEDMLGVEEIEGK